jgi:hypothetical protein
MSTTCHKTQNATILRHIKRRPITAMDAWNLYGCTRLAARIFDLREEGHPITSERVSKCGVRFTKYQLA